MANGAFSKKIINDVLRFARQYNYEKQHSHQVTKLALELFDQLKQLHKLDGAHRVLLEAGGLLHDIGWVKGRIRHHKTARDIIMSNNSLPFTQKERKFIALLARYHRRALPKKTHKYFKNFSKLDKQELCKLAGLLRVADGMDRSHTNNVKQLTCRIAPSRIDIYLKAKEIHDEEITTTMKKADLIQDALKRDIHIHWN